MESIEKSLVPIAKLLSCEHGKEITPNIAFKAYVVHVHTGLSYKECIEIVWSVFTKYPISEWVKQK